MPSMGKLLANALPPRQCHAPVQFALALAAAELGWRNLRVGGWLIVRRRFGDSAGANSTGIIAMEKSIIPPWKQFCFRRPRVMMVPD